MCNDFMALLYNIKDNEGKFLWLDGNEAEFLNWAGGSPDGGLDENCVVLNSAINRWWDSPCNLETLEDAGTTYYGIPLCQINYLGKLLIY